MSSIHPTRTTPVAHHTKKTVLRAARSAPVSKPALKGTKVKPAKSEEDLVDNFDDEDDMGCSFLQFCAMCEKQIVIPNNSILYCSESCRRKDAQIHDNDPSLSLLSAFPTSPSYEVDAELGITTRTILPGKLPTPRPLPNRIPPVAHDGKSDLDPTEWKPSEGGPAKGKPGGKEKAATWRPKLPHRPSSEAYSYLAQYHRSAPTSTPRSGNTHRSTPSLSHTPTTTASSDDGMVGTPTEVGNGSLVSHTNSSSLDSDDDVVTPKIASIVSTTRLEAVKGDDMENTLVDDISYDKKWVLTNKTSTTGRLKKLLGHGGVDNMTFTM